MVGLGFTFRELSIGGLGFFKRLGKRVPSRRNHFVCVQCGPTLIGSTLYTADASLAYEAVKLEHISRAFGFIFQDLTAISERSDFIVSVMHSVKSVANCGVERLSTKLPHRFRLEHKLEFHDTSCQV